MSRWSGLEFPSNLVACAIDDLFAFMPGVRRPGLTAVARPLETPIASAQEML